jgi:hypothetical protein
MKASPIRPVRCAIYTRVSTDQGLDQQFNSLDAQYDASSAYIKSQAHAGWALIKATGLTSRGCLPISVPARSTSSSCTR